MAVWTNDSTDDLEQIFIRARVDGRWTSTSLRQLLDGGNGGQISAWFCRRCQQQAGLDDGAVVTEASVSLMIALLERLGVPIYRLRGAPASVAAVDPVDRAGQEGPTRENGSS
jgi:hypothetical protein